MSIHIAPPFPVVGSLSGLPAVDSADVALTPLRDVVAGRVAGFSRLLAMRMLQASDFPNKHRDFETLLANPSESASVRRQAAICLANINTPAALEILMANAKAGDARVAGAVATGLGRIGGREAYDRLQQLRRDVQHHAAMQVDFAAALIAYRLGLEGDHPVASHEAEDLELRSDAARPFRISLADAADAELAIRTVAAEPFGIEFSERHVYYVRCGRSAWMILFNRDFVGEDAIVRLRTRKACLGLIALKGPQSGRYSPALLMLTAPREDGTLHILVPHTHGHLAFRGSAALHGDRADFSLRSVARPGAFAVDIAGVFARGTLDLQTARAESVVRHHRVPRRRDPERTARR